MKEKTLIFMKKNRIEIAIMLTLALVFSLRGFILFGNTLTLSQSTSIQVIWIPLIYIAYLIDMVWQKTYRKSAFSRVFFQAYLIMIIPIHVTIYYLLFSDSNVVILLFLGGYFLFCGTYFFLLMKTKRPFFKTFFWVIDAIIQFVFVYIWILVVGFQNITI